MPRKLISDETLTRIQINSFRNYHAKGVDYLCFQRSPALTLKIYFFDQGSQDQVVNPHNHRYDFATAVICGSVRNSIFRFVEKQAQWTVARSYECFDWRTPLNGGDGFAYKGVCSLVLDNAVTYGRGQTWKSQGDHIHTLDKIQPGTILVLEQYADKLPLDQPTQTYVLEESQEVPDPPSLSGLYDLFEADQILARLKQLEAVQPGALTWLRGR